VSQEGSSLTRTKSEKGRDERTRLTRKGQSEVRSSLTDILQSKIEEIKPQLQPFQCKALKYNSELLNQPVFYLQTEDLETRPEMVAPV
jgi:hypothetical protein